MSSRSSFGIGFVNSTGDRVQATAQIRIGDSVEDFAADLGYWSTSDYLASWRSALELLEKEEVAKSCLVASITDPQTSNYFSCWPLYRSGEDVFVQNAISFFAELGDRFDPRAPWTSVGPRELEDDDGNRISEWRTTMHDIRGYLTELRFLMR
jgi:CdiI N-terminal domain